MKGTSRKCPHGGSLAATDQERRLQTTQPRGHIPQNMPQMMRISSKANNSSSKRAPDWNRDPTAESAKAGKRALDPQHATPLGAHRWKRGDSCAAQRTARCEPDVLTSEWDNRSLCLWRLGVGDAGQRGHSATQFLTDSFLQN